MNVFETFVIGYVCLAILLILFFLGAIIYFEPVLTVIAIAATFILLVFMYLLGLAIRKVIFK